MKPDIFIVIFFSLCASALFAQAINYADGAELNMVGNKATYTDPKGATTVCTIIKRNIKCTDFSKITGQNEVLVFTKINGRLLAGIRKMLRDATP